MEGLKTLLLLAIIAFGVFTGARISKGKLSLKAIPLALTVLLLFAYFMLTPAMGKITAGERGVVLNMGKVTGRILGEGLYLVTPVVESVEIMDVRTKAYEASAAAASRDLQTVHTKVTVNYRLVADKVGEVYRDLRRDYEPYIISPAVQEAVKAATSKFDAESLVSRRDVVKAELEQLLRDRLAKKYIEVEAVSITDFQFSESFNAAIEQKVTAQQEALKAERDLQRVRAEAEQKIAMARAEAESLRIQRANVTPEMIRLRAIEVQKMWVNKWDGKQPTTVLGPGTNTLVNIPTGQ